MGRQKYKTKQEQVTRDKKILAARKEGKSFGKIAQELKGEYAEISRQRVFQIIQKNRGGDNK